MANSKTAIVSKSKGYAALRAHRRCPSYRGNSGCSVNCPAPPTFQSTARQAPGAAAASLSLASAALASDVIHTSNRPSSWAKTSTHLWRPRVSCLSSPPSPPSSQKRMDAFQGRSTDRSSSPRGVRERVREHRRTYRSSSGHRCRASQ